MNVRLLQTPNYAVAVTEKADAVIVTLEGTGVPVTVAQLAGPPPTRRQGRIRLQGACPGKGPPTMAKKAPTSSKSAKKPTKPGPALRGGTSCFNEDGSPVVAVWKALCETKKSSDIVVTKLANRTKDRKAIELELREMDEGDEQYAEKTKQHWQVCEEIKGLRADRDQFISRYGRIIELTNANKLPAAASPSEIFRLADESEEGEEEGDDPQLKIASALPGVRPDHLYAQWAQAFPSLFGHREGGALKPHFDKLYDPDRSSPLKLMRVIAEGFANCKTSKDRRELLPGPPWFNAGLMAVMAKAATAETCKGDAVGETGAGEVLGFMQACAAKDIDAWLDLVGGKDAPANKVLLLEASA